MCDEHTGQAKARIQADGGRHRRVAAVAALVALALAAAPPLISLAASTYTGQLYAFGHNYYGQLGNATNDKSEEPNPTPTLVALPGEIGQVTQVAAGGYHSLALTSSGQLYAFGRNYFGELGNATNDKSEEPNPTPTLVTLSGEVGPVTQVAAGLLHSLAVTSSGQLYSFGDNGYGQLGNTTNNKTIEPNPTPTLVTLPGEVGPVTQVAAGANHSLAVTSSGQLYAFGDNQYGQLGNAANNKTEEPNPTPTLVTLPGATGTVTQIAAGGDHSLAVTSTGQLYAFGDNYYGQLGSTTNDKTEEPNPTPTLVTLPGEVGPVTQVAAGANHSLAVTSTGQLYAFGDNYYGQLGSTANNKTFEPNPTPTLVTLSGKVGQVTQLAAGAFDSLALTSSGQLYAFGHNYYGQLGNATDDNSEEPNPTPTLVTLPGGATIDAMARGPMAEHTLVVIADLAVLTGSLPSATVGVAYSAQVQASGGALPYKWSASGLPLGLSINQASGVISGTPTVGGSQTATVTVTDSDGIIASAPITLSINAASSSATAAPSAPPVAPLVRSARESAKSWREGNTLAQISHSHKPPVGTTFSFILNESATVRFAFMQAASGRKVGTRCVAQTKGNRRRHACMRTLTVATLTFAGHAGTDKVRFEGRISHSKKLKPGRYTLIITAANAAGQSRPVQLSFTIVK